MELCNQLSQEAQSWANRGQFQHCQQRNGAGENLAFNCEPTAEAATIKACDDWYNEIKGKFALKLIFGVFKFQIGILADQMDLP